MDAAEVQTVTLLGSYVPRQCGIGTFAKDLRDALSELPQGCETFVVAIDDTPQGYHYGPEVRFQLQANRLEDYRTAAEMLNIHQIDVLSLQHEFGIYGGWHGDYVLTLLRHVRMPVITTLHTVLQEPSREQARVMRELARLSDRLVVMADKAVQMLQEVYHLPREKIALIPHGIPDVPFVDPAFYKDQFDFEDRQILLTFGLLSPGKGIEVAIRALPQIVERHPRVIYVVLGTTHPHILRREGTAYLESLERLAYSLGVLDHVAFHHRFVSPQELQQYVGSADLYLTPYADVAQITSGTLAYAMGAGKAIVSTPYWYAAEMLNDDRGALFPFADSDALAATICDLLNDDTKRNAIRKRAYMFSRDMIWKEVARQYVHVANEVLNERRNRPRPVFHFRAEKSALRTIPEVKMNHLRTLTDDTGIFQHALYTVPERRHGYCTDDNTRALLAAVEYLSVTQDESILREASIYMAFVLNAFDPETKRFRNFLSYDRQWIDGEECLGETHGRVLWALGGVTAQAPDDNVLSFSSRLFAQALGTIETYPSPRGWACALLGIHAYLERFPGDTMARRVRQNLAERLYHLFLDRSDEQWPWCEDRVTYSNATLPHALILSGCSMSEPQMLAQGLRSLEWLVQLQLDHRGVVSLIGNQGWMTRDGRRAKFDQQAIDAHALVVACAEAYDSTHDAIWQRHAHTFLAWFLGNNDTGSKLYDYVTGGCRDGLHPDGPNLNQGAESTLAWLLSLLAVRQLDVRADIGVTEPSGRTEPVTS